MLSPKWSREAAGVDIIGGNDPLLLDGRDAYLVATGSAGIFHCSTDDGVAGGSRYWLFTVSDGEPILWMPSNVLGGSIAVVAFESTEMWRLPMADQLAALAEGDPRAIGDLQRWTEILQIAIRSAGGQLPPHEWHPPFTREKVTGQLERLQTAFLESVRQTMLQRDEERRRRFRERQLLNVRMAERTVAELASSVRSAPHPADVAWTDSALVNAVQRVGDVQGISIRTPSASAVSRDPLAAIVDASGVRSRRVVLGAGWWKNDSGPLIGYLADTNEPVSVLPARGSCLRRPTYRIVSSVGHSTLVDESTAASLSPIAHILYPPLPDRATVFDLFRFAVKPHGRDVITALLTGVAITLLGMLIPQATWLLFEYAIPDADRAMLAHIGLALIVAATGSLLFDLVQAISIARLVTSAAGAAQMGLWDRLLQARPSFFRQFTAGEIENRANGPTEIKSELDETTLKILLGSVVSLLNVALLFYYSSRLAVVAVAIAAVALAVNAAAGALMIRIVRPLEELDGQLRGLLVQLLNAASKIRIAGAEPRAFAQWARAYTEKQRWTLALQTHSDRLQVFGMTLAPLATALLFWVAFTDLFDNPATSLSLGTFLAFLSAFGTFLAAAITLGDSSAVVLRVAAVWKRVAPILETEREFQGQKKSPGELTGRIRVKHVTFRYREEGPPTLDDVTIEAEPGECIAIVGPSGSGKSTLINLLLRFEVPLSGTITYDGHDLNTLDVLEVRRQLGVVSQENKIMAGSLYDNIVCGSLATIEDAWQAARAAGFDEDIQQMAMQMHTVVSEGGGNLSGGQRQRLLIARALVHQPRIVILDEATSALDNNTQAVVMDSLNKLQATRIIVAHRLSTVRLAHRVYVLEAGRVVQRGTFDDLMREEGLFARLMRRQAL